MISQRVEPEGLSRAELDDYLARGWYRIGRVLITTDYLVSDGELRSALWTRLDLQRHRFRPSQRKLVARSRRLFRVEVGDLAPDSAHEDLYTRYREHVGGSRAESLDEVLGGEEGQRLFHTREISLWDGDALVAFSWFDLGETSVQSLIGVYDPAYSKHGLGFCTLLLEIEHAAALGMRFHYAGYVLSEPSGMDYKRRVGALEFLDPRTTRWLGDSPYPPRRSPAEVQRRRLAEAASALTRSGSCAACVFNSMFKFAGLQEQVPSAALDPLLLISALPESPFGVLTTWDQELERYVIFSGRPVSGTLAREPGEDPTTPPDYIHLFLIEERLGDYLSVEDVAFWVRYYLPLLIAHVEE